MMAEISDFWVQINDKGRPEQWVAAVEDVGTVLEMVKEQRAQLSTEHAKEVTHAAMPLHDA